MIAKTGHKSIRLNDIISVKKCAVKLITKDGMQHPIIIFLEPVTVIYENIEKRIGQPKEFTLEKDHVDS